MTETVMTVLLVEDDDSSADLFKRILRRVGTPGVCEVVRDGEEAVRYLSGWGPFADRERYPVPCLIVLDLLLPRMDGFEFLAWIKGRRKLCHIPVFVHSVCDEPEERARAKALGAKVFWNKMGDLRGMEVMGRRIATYLRQFCRRVRREVAADA